MSVGINRGITSAMITHIWHDARKRQKNAIKEEREDLDDEEETNREWTTVDPSDIQVMSSSDEDDEETEEEEDNLESSYIPDLSDSEDTEDSDQDELADDHDSGRYSP